MRYLSCVLFVRPWYYFLWQLRVNWKKFCEVAMKIRRCHRHKLELKPHLMNLQNRPIQHNLIHRFKIRIRIIKFYSKVIKSIFSIKHTRTYSSALNRESNWSFVGRIQRISKDWLQKCKVNARSTCSKIFNRIQHPCGALTLTYQSKTVMKKRQSLKYKNSQAE